MFFLTCGGGHQLSVSLSHPMFDESKYIKEKGNKMNAWIQSRKKLSAATMAAVMAGALVAPSANAVTPDTRIGLSGIWTTANMLKEYIDWRASAGWGAVGATNLLITKLMGGSQGEMTKAAFTAICGTTAAGLVANWKPLSAPTTASHIKAIVKGGTTVGAASACGWASKFAFDTINKEIPKAQNFLNNTATPAQKSAAATATTNTLNEQLAMEAAMKAMWNANSTANFDLALASFNRHGANMRAGMVIINNTIKS
nr:hypothetical protein [uncultured Duganella sp.]